MANALSELFQNIADAIRGKGAIGPMKPSEFPRKIQELALVDTYYQKLAESIITRDASYLTQDPTKLTLKEFITSSGSILATLYPYSLAGFASVKSVELSDVTRVEEYAFYGNRNLTIIDITVPGIESQNGINFLDNALSGCPQLQTIIIRPGEDGEIMQALISKQHGGNDTFFVYVPASCYDTVISKLSDYTLDASRYRKLEDYPEIDNWKNGI